MSRGVHAFWFPPLFLDARLLWALLLFKDWVYFGCLSLSFSFFSSVSIIQFATISMVRVGMDIFINQNASKLFIDFLLCVLLQSGTRGFFVLARVCSYCAGVNNSTKRRGKTATGRPAHHVRYSAEAQQRRQLKLAKPMLNSLWASASVVVA